MSAEVVSLADARRARSNQPRNPARLQAEIRGRHVVLLARSNDVAFTPSALRSAVRHLTAMADSAESGQEVSKGIAAEDAFRLLAEAVEALSQGEKRVSDVTWLSRQLAKEVRR